MTFAKRQTTNVTLKIPMKYSDIPPYLRYVVRNMYAKKQKGLCYYCKCSLNQPAPDFIQEKRIDEDLFPETFFDSPLHLHHDHQTDMTLGVVHCQCNAVLWQYHGE